MFVVNDLTKLTQEAFGFILPLMQELADSGDTFFVLSNSDSALLQQMKDATKLNYQFYNCDGEVLSKIMEENTGIIVLSYGEVIAKYREGQLPTPGSLRIP